MCISPKTIRNRSKYICSSAKSDFTVPCGQCPECLALKKSSYLVRSYWEYEHARRSGGYVFFDTLTYNNKSLPNFYGVPCFNREDISLFVKRLRINLDRHVCKKQGFDLAGKIKFFLACENGGKKFRPHYHILFFVSDSRIGLAALKKWINKSWIYGFTDTLKNLRPIVGVEALNYVTKYVNKDSLFTKSLDDKFTEIMDYVSSKDDFDIRQKTDLIELYRKSLPFLRSSTHFGEVAFDIVDSSMIDSGQIYYYDTKNLKRVLSLPLYYRRKRFYDLRRYFGSDGVWHYSYTLNCIGQNYLSSDYPNRIDRIQQSFNTWLINAPESANIVSSILGTRTFKDLAVYKLVYYHTYIDIDKYIKLSPKEYYLSSFGDLSFIESLYSCCGTLIDAPAKRLISAGLIRPSATFHQDFVDQYGVLPFDGFDEILHMFDSWCSRYSEEIQKRADFLEEVEHKLQLYKP